MNTPRSNSLKLKPTQKDIAKKANVTQATVSLALNNDPSLPRKTCLHIQKIARDLGYYTDPFLSGLSAYRRKIRPPSFRGTLAWLSNYPEGSSWKQSPIACGYFKGASQRASELGYHLEEHILTSRGMTNRRMERILRARSISGILLAPQPQSEMVMDFNFSKFCAVSLGFTLKKPRLHLVILHQFRSMKTLFQRLLERGYKRPGLAISLESDLRADRNWSGAFLSEQLQLPQDNQVPLFIPPIIDRAPFLKWYHLHQPDVVITIPTNIFQWLQDDGVQIPQKTGFALLTIPNKKEPFSGIWENPEVIGAKAVEMLIDLMHRGEWGCPAVPLSLLVDGTWIDGQTVRQQK